MSLKVAVIGYGNIGKFAVEAVLAAPDMTLAGVVRRQITEHPVELADIPLATSVDELGPVDAALLCIPTRLVYQYASKLLAKGINTIDSFDIHGKLVDLRLELDKIARMHNSVAVVASGWDPGTDSLIRALFELMAPKGITYTNFGPGMSMGHTVAVKAIDGVENALSVTIPVGTGIHRRLVYVQLTSGADFSSVEKQIKQDPYFAGDQTYVYQVNDVDSLKDMGHGVLIERKGVAGKTDNQVFKYEMRVTTPALTAQNMVAAARASVKQKPGAYTVLEIPVIHFLSGDREALLRRLV